MTENQGASQRLTATVIRALWKKSPQMVVESYRILHDRPVEAALFDGETLMARYEIDDEPRLGPLPILRRALSVSADEALRYFGGNVSPYVTSYLPESVWPPKPVPETDEQKLTPGAISSWEGTRHAMRLNRTGPSAPKWIADDDVLWDIDNPRSWVGVRYLMREGDTITECLDAVCVEYTRQFRTERAWEILTALNLTPDTVLALEYQQAVVAQNNRNIFQVLRRSRLADAEYIQMYVGR